MPHNTNRERNAEQIGAMKFPVSYGIIAPLGRLVGAGVAGGVVQPAHSLDRRGAAAVAQQPGGAAARFRVLQHALVD